VFRVFARRRAPSSIHTQVGGVVAYARGWPAGTFPSAEYKCGFGKSRAHEARSTATNGYDSRTHAPTHPPIVLLLLLLYYSTALSSFHCHHYTLPQVRVVASGLQPLGGNVNIPKFSSALFALSISVHVLQDIDCVFNTDARRGYRDINNI